MEAVIDNVYNTIKSNNMIQPNDKVLVALSGGADSVFLLKSLVAIRDSLGFEIYCAHMNHGIRGKEAERDRDFCLQLCKNENIKLFVEFVDIPKLSKENKISVETCGRNERYQFFHRLCNEYGFNKIAVAHNMNDSVETIIINMIRGASLKGLSGIECVNNIIIRPIINVSRSDIEYYLHKHNISYCTDSTNLTTDYTRNKIRHIIITAMKKINPSVIRTIHQNSYNLKSDNDFMDDFAGSLNCITVSDNVYVDKKIFDKQHNAIKKRILLKAFNAVNGSNMNIGTNHIDILLEGLKSGNSYDMPNDIKVYVSFDKIVFTNDVPDNTYHECRFIPETTIQFGKKIVIKSKFVNNITTDEPNCVYIDFDALYNRCLVLRSRMNGDKIIPLGMKHSKKIKQLMTELKIPANIRNNIPLLCDEAGVIAVLPYRISEMYKVTEKTKKILKIQMMQEIKENEYI